MNCLVHTMLLVCIFLELTVRYWIANWCALSEEDHLSHSHFSLVNTVLLIQQLKATFIYAFFFPWHFQVLDITNREKDQKHCRLMDISLG